MRPAGDRPDTSGTSGASAHAPAPRVADLDALLRDLDSLRLSVSTDLTLAAAALDAGSPDVAGSVIDSDRATLLAFEQRALRHLERLSAAATPTAAAAEPAVAPAIPHPRKRSRASRALLPAGPLLAAAAAVLGVLGGFVPSSAGTSPATSPASTSTAVASYTELTRLTLDGADTDEVRRAAEQLHDQLETIVAQAGNDPVAAQEALALLESETLVLDSSADRDALSQVIAEARAMVARLKAFLPPAPRTPRAPAVPVRTPDVRVFEVAPVPDSGPPAPAAPTAPTPEPTPSPSRTAEPTAEPTPAPAESTSTQEPSEEPTPQEQPSGSPQPSSGSESVLPGVADPR